MIARHRLLATAAAAAFAGPGTQIAAGASSSHCATGPRLRGRLTERATNCRTARRVADGYFRQSPPGEHVGTLTIQGFDCESTYHHSEFHISCHRRRAHVWFVGTA
jgi:hypothetical protein